MGAHLQQAGSLPSWLISALGTSFSNLDFHRVQPVTPKRWQVDFDEGFSLVGEPDAIWEFPNGRWFIADYKMASLSQAQERLLPLYQTQLNVYAYLAEKLRRRHIAGLALVYFEPESSDQALADHDLFWRTQRQLILGFRCKVVPVEVKTADWLETLCERVFEILSSPNPPKGRQGCQGCQAMAEWLTRIQSHCL